MTASAGPEPLTYKWRHESGPGDAKAQFSNHANLNPTVTFPATGTYTLRLSVSDEGSLRSDVVVIHRSESGGPLPTVSLTAPANNALFAHPATVTLTATASNASKVEYYAGNKKIGESTAGPTYTVHWSPPRARRYRVTAKAIGSGSRAAFSAARIVQVGSFEGISGGLLIPAGDGLDNGTAANPNDPDYDPETNDEDGDGLTDAEEIRIGLDPGSKHSDNDGVPDGEDGWALDGDLSPPRLPEVRYASIKLSTLGITGFPLQLADNGDILWREEDSQRNLGAYKLWSNGASTQTNKILLSPDGSRSVEYSSGGTYNIPEYQDPDMLTSYFVNSGWVGAMNNRGSVCGTAGVTSYLVDPDSHTSEWRWVYGAALWPEGEEPVQILGWYVGNANGNNPTGPKVFYPYGINEADDLVGIWNESAGNSPASGVGYIPQAEGPDSVMEELPFDSQNPSAFSINNQDPPWISGNDSGAVFWVKVGDTFVKKKLPGDPSGTDSSVNTFQSLVNDSCQFVGLSSDGSSWVVRNAVYRNLASLVSTPIAGVVRDQNNHGAILTTKELLVPVELYDDAINSPPVAWNGETLSLAQVQSIPTIITKAFIKDNGIAWIKAHTSESNDAPEMPKLVARAPIPGAANLTYKWRLEVKYKRPNGRLVAEDTVKIPTDGSWKSKSADEGWRIFEEEDWDKEINGKPAEGNNPAIPGKGFFGGTAKLFLWTPGNPEPTKPIYEFKIGGENPDPQRAKDYIDEKADEAASNEAGNQGLPVGSGLWYAYAIAKHEAGQYNGGDVHRYNQFWERKGRWAGVDHYPGEVIWIDNPGESPPKGFGLYQVTGTKTNKTADIPRRQLWNWQDNVRAGVEIIAYKKYGPIEQEHAVKWIQRQQNSSNANGVPIPQLTVGTITFTESGVHQMVDAVAMKAYNGASRVDPSAQSGMHQGFILNTAVSGHFCYWFNDENTWALNRLGWPHLKNYVELVCEEIEE